MTSASEWVSPTRAHELLLIQARSPQPRNWSVSLAAYLGADLQSNYSAQLYGGEGRTPLAALRVVWLDLLSDAAVSYTHLTLPTILLV